MKTEIKTIDGTECLVIVIPTQKPTLSGSGKSLLVASGSQKTTCMVNNKPLTVTLNAYIKPD